MDGRVAGLQYSGDHDFIPTSPEPPVVATVSVDAMRERIRRKSRLKGRQVDDGSRDEVCALIGPAPAGGHRRDLLIEHLHKINDAGRACMTAIWWRWPVR